MIQHSRPWITETEVTAVAHVVRSGMLLGGSEIVAFKSELSQKINQQGVRLSSSGRLAIVKALKALKLPFGKQVAVQTYVCDAVVWAIQEAGLVPRFSDIGAGWLATAETTACAVTDDTVAIILAPPFGLVQNVSEFRKFGLPVIHDLCQASPLAIRALNESDPGDMVVMSFDPTKYMCAGGGGALFDLRTSEADASLPEVGVPPITEMQAALGRAQLRQLEQLRARRVKLARHFGATGWAKAMLANLHGDEVGDLFRLPAQLEAGFEEMQKAFLDRGIIVRRGVDSLAHRSYGLDDALFPNAARAFLETVSIPFYPALSDHEAERVAEALECLT